MPGNFRPSIINDAIMETTTIQKQITISAPVYEVWDVLVNNTKINQWAEAFGKGVHAETDWAEGSEIVWKDRNNEVCGTGIITSFRVYDTIRTDFYHKTNPELVSPTGRYAEAYSVKKVNDQTTILSITAGPMNDQEICKSEPLWDLALEKMKAIAEDK
jgi:uncharacterized protein YndB with AHSA1/START domain